MSWTGTRSEVHREDLVLRLDCCLRRSGRGFFWDLVYLAFISRPLGGGVVPVKVV